MESVQEIKEERNFNFQKIKEFVTTNYLIIFAVLAFIGLLFAVYFVYFKDLLSPQKKGDESLGEISVEDPNGGINLSDTYVFLAPNVEIVEWPQVNKVYQLVDISIMLDLISAMQELGFAEVPSEYFSSWSGSNGEATLYSYILKVSLNKSDIKINISDDNIDSAAAEVLNNLFHTEYFNSYTFSIKNVSGYESIIGTLSVDGYRVLTRNFEETLIEIVFDSAGRVTYISLPRFLPDFNKVGTYNGYDPDGILYSFQSGVAGSKILKTKIVFDEYTSIYDDPTTEEDPNYATGIVFSDIDFQNLSIFAMGQVYYLDVDSGYLVPVVIIQGKSTVGVTPGLDSGVYTMEFWHSNVK